MTHLLKAVRRLQPSNVSRMLLRLLFEQSKFVLKSVPCSTQAIGISLKLINADPVFLNLRGELSLNEVRVNRGNKACDVVQTSARR